MKTLFYLTKRNMKMFFKDKGMFFTSLITPIILLVLFVTFLAKVYKQSLPAGLPEGIQYGIVNGQLFSSLFAVSCVTVAFCANMLMVSDKVNGTTKDIYITPTKKSTIAMSYYFASLFATLLVALVGTVACFIYIGATGWYMSFGDVVLIFIDLFMLSLFGTALSSIINCFLSSQGQISAVGTIVSAGYGFICGAYMPISQMGAVMQNVLAFLPGTYGTSLLKYNALNGVFREMSKQGISADVISGIKDNIDCNLYFFGNQVSIGTMYGIMIGSIILLIGAYILISVLRAKKKK